MTSPTTVASPQRQGALVLLALGVVYGDIGTSPLYTLRECLSAATGIAPDLPNVLGFLSLIFWALIVVVTVKYVFLLLRADNRGEGGTLALMTLVAGAFRDGRARRRIVALGMVGAALFFGDALLTPAISVLGAVEGLKVAAPVLEKWIVPLSVCILVVLFAVQRFGTHRVGRLFGPIVLLWFVAIGALGAVSIAETPAVLAAVDPRHAVGFFAANGWVGALALGVVVLAVTGVEALYADVGHFGRRAVAIAWNFVALPGLLLNYFGQGALLLRQPAAIENPFYLLAPDWALYPLIVLATLATVIASQAVISGAFSLARQAVLFGLLPRLAIRHTSAAQRGQIYMPAVNVVLFAGVVALVVGFGGSSALAGAYGIAVTGVMVTTAVLFALYLVRVRRWRAVAAAALVLPFLVVDAAFFAATMTKIPDGGWVSIAVALGTLAVMHAWWRGRPAARRLAAVDSEGLDAFVARLAADRAAPDRPAAVARVPGVAVFLSASPDGLPHALLHNIKHNHVLHDTVLIATVEADDRPRVPLAEQVAVRRLGAGFFRITIRHGFMQHLDVPAGIARAAEQAGFACEPLQTSYFFGRDKFVVRRGGVRRWREALFVLMQRNALSVADFFNIPANRTVELGTQIEI